MLHAESTLLATPTGCTLDPSSSDDQLPRVLHLINGEHYSGAERVQDLLAMELPSHGFDVGLVCVKPDRFPRQRICQDTPLYQVPMSGRFRLDVVKKIAFIVKQANYHLLHAHTPRTCMLARIVSSIVKVPFLYHVHSPTIQDSSRSWQNRINSWIERLSLTGVGQILTVSESLGKHMGELGFANHLISVVPNGVPSRNALTSRTVPSERWIIGTIALFRPRKGIEILLQAISSLRQMGYEVQLRAVGIFETPAYEQEIKRLVTTLGLERFVDWRGFSSDVFAELDQMDIMVLPSLYGEGLPMVVLEAMAAGVPVVATRVEGVPEVLADGSGELAVPGSAESLSQALRRVIRGDVSWSEMRRNAFHRQAKLYSDHAMAAGVAAAYRRVMARSSKLTRTGSET